MFFKGIISSILVGSATLNPKIRGRLKGISKTELNSRLPILIDALLEDDDYWKISNTSLQSKDRLKDQITEYEIIREVRVPFLDLLPEDPTWRTRAGLACEASKTGLIRKYLS